MAGGLAMEFTGLAIIVLLFVLVVPFEKLFPRHRGQRVRRPGVGTDMAYALATPLLGAIGVAVAIVIGMASLAWLPGLALRPLVGAMPGWLTPLVGIALFDLAIYWVHRWSHEVGFLWRFHAIHHSTEKLDWISGLRNHPFDGAIVAPPFILLVAAGFSPEFSGALAVIQFATGLFAHANVRWRLRPLHRIVFTPEFHHWHHANEPESIHTNYSVFLPAWDQLFGTYRMPRDLRPSRYGVDEPIPAGIAAQLLHPLRGMGNPLRVLRHPIVSVRSGARFVRALVAEMARTSHRPVRRF